MWKIDSGKIDAKRREAIRHMGTNVTWTLLSERSGVTVQTINNWRNGRFSGSTQKIGMLVDGFVDLGIPCSFDDLVSYS